MGNDNDLRSRETALQFDPDARSVYGSTSYSPGSGRDYLEDSEDRGTLPSHSSSAPASQPAPRFQKLRRRGGAIAIIIALLGGGAAVTIPSMPAIGLNYIMEKFNLDFDYQSHGSSRRIAKLTDAKFHSSGKNCRGVKSCEQLTTVSDREARIYREAGITVDRQPLPGSSDNTRGRITRMEYTDPYTGTKSVVTSYAEYTRAMADNPGFARAIKSDSHNARFIVNDDKLARTRLAAHGASKADPLRGDDEKSLRESFNDAVSGKKAANLGANLKPVKDDKDQTVGYTDENGTFRSVEEVEAAKQNANQLKEAEKMTSRGVLKNFAQGAVRSVNAIGYLATACSLRATQKAISFANELVKKRQLIKLAAVFNAVAGEVKASNTGVNIDTSNLDKKVEMLGNLVTTVLENEEMIVDPDSPADNPRYIKNPHYGKLGYDADILKLSGDGDFKPLGERAQRFAFGSGLGGGFGKVDRAINQLLGNRDKEICKIVNNPLVQLAGLGVGVAAGAGSGGTLTAVMAAASIGLAFASPYLISTLADIMSGKLTEDLAGTDLVDAVGVGTQLYQADVARASGFMPASPAEATDYLSATKAEYAEYARLESQRAAPFDITNQYSFLGSLARSTIPHVSTSSRTLGSMALNISGIFSAASSSLLSSVHAADYVSEERFNQCPLEKYKQAGVAADVTCIAPLTMSKEAMDMDVAENSIWMEKSGNIEPGSFPGTPRDNGQPWNYKKYADICLKDNPEDPDAWLTECTRRDRKELNDHFAAYTLGTRIETAQSTDPKQADAKSSDSNAMSSDGWVFPTALDARITSGFGLREGGEHHKGIDFAMSSAAETMNKPIYAARAGKVIAAGPMSGYGNWIVIDHGNDIYTLYGHMEDDGVMASTGQDVRAGQQIGKIGNKGQSTGPHLHYEKWVGKNPTNGQGNGGPVDPTADVTKAHQEAKAREAKA